MSGRRIALLAACATLGLGVVSVACSGEDVPPPVVPPVVPPPALPPAAVQEPLVGGPFPTLLLAQAQFVTGTDNKPKPGAALLTIWRKGPEGWTSTKLEDADSNVFHKALPYEGGILTIGAEKAWLKKWTFADGSWKGVGLWNPDWDGKFDRIRDLEIGDVNGDGAPEVIMATHDAGVIGVGTWREGKLDVLELDKEADTFVHEIEIGDIDGDGKNEFFATPSGRNNASGKSQPGRIVMYRWDGTTYARTVVDDLAGSHAKEIVAVDLDGKGTSTLFSVIEAETELVDGKPKIVKPVEIRRYTYGKKDKSFTHDVATTIEDRQTRFLVPADYDGDGKTDLVAAAMKTGIWMLSQGPKGTWTTTNIETQSSGFEHASYAADLDGNGVPELYVAADDQRQLRAYQWNAATKSYDKTVIGAIPKTAITWNITTGSF